MKTILYFSAIFCFFSMNLLAQVWEPQVPDVLPDDYYVSDISIVNDQIIWAVAVDYSVPSPVPASHINILLRTTDGGATWEVKNIDEAMGRLSWDIHAFDENKACITTQNLGPAGGRGIFRTTDGGETWLEVFNHSAGGVWLHFFDDQEGICINRQSMARTMDGGISWSLIPSGNIPAFQSEEFTILNAAGSSLESFGDILWFGTDKGRIYKSNKQGNTWTATYAGLGSNATIFSVAFTDERNGAALFINPNSSNYQLAKTSDGGSSWNTVDLDYEFEEVIAIPCSRVFMGVSWDDNFTAISTDLGDNWSILDDQISAWVPVFQSPNLGWMANGSDDGADPALYKWVGGALYGRTYVDQNATGNNDGSSWADAYTDLQDALAAASDGSEIWVAEGTYKPGDNPESTFFINKNIHMYGGFSGNECDASDRDLELHPTILSGDLNGDDILDDFMTNRTDNATTVLTLTSSEVSTALIDGFIFENGHANTTQSDHQSYGGAIYSIRSLQLKNCIFRQNYAIKGGGAIRQYGSSIEELSIEDCSFESNKANYGGSVSIFNTTIFVNQSRFEKNTNFDGTFQANGGGMYIVASSGSVQNCSFSENEAYEYSAAILIWNPVNFNDSQVEVLDCTFENNVSSGGGGGLDFLSFGNDNSYIARGCTFIGNHSAWYGSALSGITYGDNVSIEIESCYFSNNTCNGEATVDLWGTDGASGSITVDSCIFENNNALYAGALEMGNGWNGGADVSFTLSNSVFKNNSAMESGAILLWCKDNSQTDILVDNCEFDGNAATIRGGAIGLSPENENFNVTFNRTKITNNHSPQGSAIDAYNYFQEAFPSSTNLLIENSLISHNTGSSGAVIALDSTMNFSMLNCTVVDNQSGGIQLSNQSTLILQNTIFFNNNEEFQALTNNVTVTSNGGNLIGDLSLDGFLNTTTDQQDVDPLFVAANDFNLSDESPGINAGISDGVTAQYDLDGNVRIYGNVVDIGAYENQLITATATKSIQQLNLWPNPATHFLYIQLPESVVLPVEVNLYNSTGKILKSQTLSTDQAIDLEGLPAGVYLINLHIKNNLYIGTFTKV